MSEALKRACVDCRDPKTPFAADPESIQRAQELHFEPPLDEGIKEIVLTLIAHGIETSESCEGGHGHAYPEPTVRFEGGMSEGPRAAALAIAYGFPVKRLRRTWAVLDSMLHGPWWEMTFATPQPAKNKKSR
jgi:hypothetical protein